MPTSSARRAVAAARLHLTTLEDRLTPALAFQFDYSLDATGFFNDPAHRAALERAGAELLSRVGGTLSAINPSGVNTWSAVFANPSTGQDVRLSNLSVAADTLVVYAGGAGAGPEAGLGGPGGYSASGNAAWQNTVADRGVAAGFTTWGGSVAFDTDLNWYFGADAAARPAGEIDFQSIGVHELGHTLGLGTSAEWDALVSGDKFVGRNAQGANGGPVQLHGDRAHFAQGTKSGGQSVSLQPVMDTSRRVGFSALDYAALADIGWQVTTTSAPAAPTTPLPVRTTAPAPTPAVAAQTEERPAAAQTETQTGNSGRQVAASPADRLIVLSGPTDGTVQAYSTAVGGTLTPVGSAFRPFPGAAGPVRSVTADVNADGVADWVLGTGPGGGSRVRVLDGRTFADLVPEYWAFEPSFTGGVYLAAADFDGDGRAEVVITPDQGGGPRVQILSVGTGQFDKRADFFGLSDPSFRGGARVAAGDLNGDGTPDLAVSAGFGGGPRISLLDGRAVTSGRVQPIAGDFFAFDPALRNGTYVAIGDTNGDGFGDLILGAGPGGGPRVLTLNGQTLTTAGPEMALATPLGDTFAGDPNARGGVRVGAKDFDGDGVSDVIAGAGLGGTAFVLNPKTGYGVSAALAPFGEAGLDGIYVG